MSDMNTGHLMRNLMDESKKKRYDQKRDKLLKKMYGMLPSDKCNRSERTYHLDVHNPMVGPIIDTPAKNGDYVTRQSSIRNKLIAEINNKPVNK